MTQFLLLNCKDFILHQDTQSIQTQTQYCFCCLANNTQLISLIHCKHSSYLNLFDINQLEQSKRVVCYKCHSMLETIETFRQQVINAREKLTNQTIFGSAIYHKPQMLDIDVPPLSAIKKIKREVYGSDLSIQDPCCMLMNGNENNEDNLISVLPHVKDEPTDTERCSVKTDQGTETHTHGVTSHIIVKLEDVATQESLAHNVKVEIDQEPTSTTVSFSTGDEQLIDLTSPDMLSESLITAKSREKYLTAYDSFIQWKSNKKTESFSENVFLAYFSELANTYKPSSLWCIYSMLRSMAKLKHGVDIKTYRKLMEFLKRRSDGYIGRKSKVLSPADVEKFLNEAPDSQYLATKVALIFGVTGACKRQELYNITTKDVETHGDILLVKITQTKTKIPRSFTIQGIIATFQSKCSYFL